MLTSGTVTCKPLGPFRGSVVLLSLGLALGAGCTTVESQSFRVQKNSNVESAQIATDADFSRYERLQAEEMGIYFPPNAATPVEDQQRIRQVFRTAFLAELEGYDISREPGPSTMKVQASLIDLRGSGGALPQMRREIQEVARPGSIVFLMEMSDSQTDRVLARAADSASAPTFATGGETTTDWASVEAAAQRWAELFRQFLDQNLSQ